MRLMTGFTSTTLVRVVPAADACPPLLPQQRTHFQSSSSAARTEITGLNSPTSVLVHRTWTLDKLIGYVARQLLDKKTLIEHDCLSPSPTTNTASRGARHRRKSGSTDSVVYKVASKQQTYNLHNFAHKFNE